MHFLQSELEIAFDGDVFDYFHEVLLSSVVTVIEIGTETAFF